MTDKEQSGGTNVNAGRDANVDVRQDLVSRDKFTVIVNNYYASEASDDQQKIVTEQDWEKATQRYAEYIQREYGTVQIWGQREPRPLDEIFTDVYIHDKPTAWRRFNIDALQDHFAEYQRFGRHGEERRKGLEAVQTIEKMFVLGKPGAGKTTFCKYFDNVRLGL